jgi:hypothetical protein
MMSRRSHNGGSHGRELEVVNRLVEIEDEIEYVL